MKHGLASGAELTPQRPDWTVDQGWDNYTAQEHAVWKTLFERQTQLLPGLACDAFVEGMKNLPITVDCIPDFVQLSQALQPATGWQVVAVSGLVPDEVFFEHLANRRFPAGNFIRRAHQLDYLEEPDVFHDVFGHVPMLMHPVMADFIQAYGEAGLRAQRLGKLTELARVCTGTRWSLVWSASQRACVSMARALHRRIRKVFFRCRANRPTASVSIWSV